MQERSEEQIISRLLQLENEGGAERRAGLTGGRFLSLLQDPDTGLGYVLRHGFDDTEGAEIPPGTEFWEYPTASEAALAFDQLLSASGRAGTVVEDDSTEDIGDSETDGAELGDLYSANDDDLLINAESDQDPLHPPEGEDPTRPDAQG